MANGENGNGNGVSTVWSRVNAAHGIIKAISGRWQEHTLLADFDRAKGYHKFAEGHLLLGDTKRALDNSDSAVKEANMVPFKMIIEEIAKISSIIDQQTVGNLRREVDTIISKLGQSDNDNRTVGDELWEFFTKRLPQVLERAAKVSKLMEEKKTAFYRKLGLLADRIGKIAEDAVRHTIWMPHSAAMQELKNTRPDFSKVEGFISVISTMVEMIEVEAKRKVVAMAKEDEKAAFEVKPAEN